MIKSIVNSITKSIVSGISKGGGSSSKIFMGFSGALNTYGQFSQPLETSIDFGVFAKISPSNTTGVTRPITGGDALATAGFVFYVREGLLQLQIPTSGAPVYLSAPIDEGVLTDALLIKVGNDFTIISHQGQETATVSDFTNEALTTLGRWGGSYFEGFITEARVFNFIDRRDYDLDSSEDLIPDSFITDVSMTMFNVASRYEYEFTAPFWVAKDPAAIPQQIEDLTSNFPEQDYAFYPNGQSYTSALLTTPIVIQNTEVVSFNVAGLNKENTFRKFMGSIDNSSFIDYKGINGTFRVYTDAGVFRNVVLSDFDVLGDGSAHEITIYFNSNGYDLFVDGVSVGSTIGPVTSVTVDALNFDVAIGCGYNVNIANRAIWPMQSDDIDSFSEVDIVGGNNLTYSSTPPSLVESDFYRLPKIYSA